MDGEDVYGHKIRVQFVQEQTSFSNSITRSPSSCNVRSSPRSVFRHRSSSLSDGVTSSEHSKGASVSTRHVLHKSTFSSLKSSTVADFRDLGCHPLGSVSGVEDIEKTAKNNVYLDNEDSENDVIICGPEEEVDIEVETVQPIAANSNHSNNIINNYTEKNVQVPSADHKSTVKVKKAKKKNGMLGNQCTLKCTVVIDMLK